MLSIRSTALLFKLCFCLSRVAFFIWSFSNLPTCHLAPSVVLGQFVFRLSVQHPGENLGVPWLLKSDVHHHLSFSAWPSVWMHCGSLRLRSLHSAAAAAAAMRVCLALTNILDVCSPMMSVHMLFVFACSCLPLHCTCMTQYSVFLCYTTHLWLCSDPICAFPPLSTFRKTGWALGRKLKCSRLNRQKCGTSWCCRGLCWT